MRPAVEYCHTAFLYVSIHAPARGATLTCNTLVCLSSFNPRTRTGCDIIANWALVNQCVSIHAPARGATLRPLRSFRLSFCFNPRTRTGCDPNNSRCISTRNRFNPRTRTGCDCRAFIFGEFRMSFNPRTRTGCDLSKVRLIFSNFVFQSTHPHGVRLKRRA